MPFQGRDRHATSQHARRTLDLAWMPGSHHALIPRRPRKRERGAAEMKTLAAMGRPEMKKRQTDQFSRSPAPPKRGTRRRGSRCFGATIRRRGPSPPLLHDASSAGFLHAVPPAEAVEFRRQPGTVGGAFFSTATPRAPDSAPTRRRVVSGIPVAREIEAPREPVGRRDDGWKRGQDAVRGGAGAPSRGERLAGEPRALRRRERHVFYFWGGFFLAPAAQTNRA